MLSLDGQQFDEFKTSFYKAFANLEDLNCGNFNLLKVVQDGLKVNYVKRGWYKADIFKPYYLQYLELEAKDFFAPKKKLILYKTSPYLIFDSSKITKDDQGNYISHYFSKIEASLGTSDYFKLSLTKLPWQTEEDCLTYNHLQNTYANVWHNAKEKKLINNLREVLKRIKKTVKLADIDLKNIETAFNNFFVQYKVFSRFIEQASFTHCFFIQHYHREGMIMALKEKNIKCIEFQHGLIAKEDIFYVYPQIVASVASRALFPDHIFTYGEYWKNVLLSGYEFNKNQVHTLGIYYYISDKLEPKDKQELNTFLNENEFILITTQTFLEKYFIEYTTFLSKQLHKLNSSLKIVVKLHPSEKIDLYSELFTLNNVRVLTINTEYLLKRCTYHVSCYSTTIFDAMKYKNPRNFSLAIPPCLDYVKDMIEAGVTNLLQLNQTPMEIETHGKTLNASIFFEDFEKNKFKLDKVLNN